MSIPRDVPRVINAEARAARKDEEDFSSSQGNATGSKSAVEISSASRRGSSILLARTNLLPSARTSKAPAPASRLRSMPFVPPPVNQEKFGCEDSNTPPSFADASMRTNRSVGTHEIGRAHV